MHSEAFYTVDHAIQVFDILLKSTQHCLKHESMKQTIKNYLLLLDMHMYQAFWWQIQLLVYVHNDSAVYSFFYDVDLYFYSNFKDVS